MRNDQPSESEYLEISQVRKISKLVGETRAARGRGPWQRIEDALPRTVWLILAAVALSATTAVVTLAAARAFTGRF